MKKVFAILCVVFIIIFLVACDTNKNNPTKPNEPSTNTDISTTESSGINDDGSVNYNFEFFEATGTVYGEDSLISKFPLINTDDEFWNQIQFTVFANEGCGIEILKDSPSRPTWAEFKDITVDNINMLTLGGNDTILPAISVNIKEDVSKTWHDVVKDGDWWGNCYVDEQKHVNLLFPIEGDSIAEMIVSNYGQPSEIDDSMEGYFEIHYNVRNRCITMRISENPSPENDELPYKIQLFVRFYEG